MRMKPQIFHYSRHHHLRIVEQCRHDDPLKKMHLVFLLTPISFQIHHNIRTVIYSEMIIPLWINLRKTKVIFTEALSSKMLASRRTTIMKLGLKHKTKTTL